MLAQKQCAEFRCLYFLLSWLLPSVLLREPVLTVRVKYWFDVVQLIIVQLSRIINLKKHNYIQINWKMIKNLNLDLLYQPAAPFLLVTAQINWSQKIGLKHKNRTF